MKTHLITHGPLLDQNAIESLRALSPDDGDGFLKEILTIFLEDTPARIAELHNFRTSGNPDGFIRAAHSIKGSSSNIGAIELRSVAAELENQARQHGITQINDHLNKVEAAYARLQAILIEMLSN